VTAKGLAEALGRAAAAHPAFAAFAAALRSDDGRAPPLGFASLGWAWGWFLAGWSAAVEARPAATDLPCGTCGAAAGLGCLVDERERGDADRLACVGMSGGYEVHRSRADAYYARVLREGAPR